jgi:hypothetical protein
MGDDKDVTQDAGLPRHATTTATTATTAAADTAAHRAAVERDGITGLPGLFPRSWAERLRLDFEAAFADARSRERGTIGRGPQRFYFAVHPEAVTGFADLAGHPVLAALFADVLGADYRIVELGFDVPLPGAVHQPWHRDFPAPPESAEHRLTSLAVNVSTVDVSPDMGPFEIAPGTHWDDGRDFDHGMFPRPGAASRYDGLASRRHPRQGDVSVRTGLAVHRGTPNTSRSARAVLILGATASHVATDVHQLAVRPAYLAALPAAVRDHLRCTVVDEPRPIVQSHDIEGLVMGLP